MQRKGGGKGKGLDDRVSDGSDALVRVLAEGRFEGIAVVRDLEIRFANQVCAEVFGYPDPEAMVGLRVEALLPPEEQSRLTRMTAARPEGREAPSRYQFQGIRRDGSPVWIDQRAGVIDWEGAPAILCTFLDVTNQRERERELEEKDALLDMILEALPVGLSVIDKDLRILVHNRQAIAMYDLPEALASPGGSFEAVMRYNAERGEYGPGDPEQQARERVELARRFLPHQMERQRPDGRWLEVKGNPIPGGGFISVSADITERKRMERALADSERLLQTTLDRLPLWVSVKDRKGRYLVCNRTMVDDLGLPREALLGHTAMELPLGDEAATRRLHETDLRVIASGQVEQATDARFRLPDGRVVLHDYTKLPLRAAAGEVVGMVTVAEDVTERRQAELALEQFKATLDRTLDCVFMFDPDSLRFVYVNRGAREQVGYSEAELLAMTPVDLKPEFDTTTFRALITPLRQGERDSLTFETQHRARDGTLIPVEVFLQYVEIESGASRFVAIVRDVTERRRLEAQLLQAQKMEAVGTLAGGIAHDFNNALVPILGYSQLLLERSAPGSEENRWLQVVNQAAERARDLVSQILLYSRQSMPNRKRIDLVPVTHEVVRFLRSSLPSSIAIEESMPEQAWGDADAVQVHQVLMNLCINAAQAMPDGGRLRVGLESVSGDGVVSVLGRAISGPHHRLTVSDSGMGMDGETLHHIFEPFYTTKDVGQGTGLGLSTVLGIVDRHGGAVCVHSVPGEGSTFEVYLPAEQGSAQTPATSTVGRSAGHERILLVDDEAAVVEVGQALLGERGYQVTGRADSREALRLLESDPLAFDLLILDWTMPELGGDKLAEEARKLNSHVPIILCTGYGDEALATGIGHDAFSAVVRKPYRIDALASAVRRLLDEARAAQGQGAA